MDQWIILWSCSLTADSLSCLTSLGRFDSPFQWPGCELCFSKGMVGQVLLFMRSINQSQKNHDALTWFLHFFQSRLAGYSSWDRQESDKTEWLSTTYPLDITVPFWCSFLLLVSQCLCVSDEQPRLILAAQTSPGPWIHSFFRPRPRLLLCISTLGSPLVGALQFPILYPSGQMPHGTGDHGDLLWLA